MEGRATSMAISCMWAWMVPHFYIEFTEYRLALTKVSLTTEEENNRSVNSDDDDKNKIARETLTNATVRGVCWAIGIMSILYMGSALLIVWLTSQPDQNTLTKPDAIAVGVGRLLSSALLAYFSVEVPKWLGISYSSQTHVECYKRVSLILDNKCPHRELSFRVCWSILGHFFIMYPLLLVYFCNESIAHIVLSTLIGIIGGFAVVYFMWLGHTKLNHKQRTKLAILLSLGIALSSAATFSAGCWYIKEVWLDDDSNTGEYAVITFFSWFGLCLWIHAILVRLTRRKLNEAKFAKEELQKERTNDINTVDATLTPSELGEWRFTSQIFQPPKSINCMAMELSRSLPPFRKKERKTHTESNEEDPNFDDTHRAVNARIISDESSRQNGEILVDEELRLQAVTSELSLVEMSSNGLVVTSSEYPTLNDSILDCEEDERSCSRSSVGGKPTTIWSMVRNNSCCRRRKHYEAPREKGWSKVATIVKWTVWALVCFWHVSFFIVDIGANHARNKTRRALAGTFEELYPDNYNTGPMCAWDEASPNANIQTFDSVQDVRDANYTVIHCGECASCSNWNDLSLQWTTRDVLAKKAKNCLAKNLFGSEEDVQECNQESIGFTEECSMCWTTDQFCARKHCTFLYFQSVLTNQINNFNVGADDITAATCDEALCGPEFVPCSGATRRRMNIVSDIVRPESQQCRQAKEDWSVVFGHP